MPTIAAYLGAAIAEIAGCFVFWAWLWLVEGVKPDRWDMAGAVICLVGAAIIIAAPHGSV
jgi:small multidrug resistance family-3 protein